jgi:hypothetical protein
MMDILMSETCWAHKNWNKITSDIKLVFHFSNIYQLANSCRLQSALYIIVRHLGHSEKLKLVHSKMKKVYVDLNLINLSYMYVLMLIIFWVITPCMLLYNPWCFGGNCYLRLHGISRSLPWGSRLQAQLYTNIHDVISQQTAHEDIRGITLNFTLRAEILGSFSFHMPISLPFRCP